MAKVKKAVKYEEVKLPFFDHRVACTVCDGTGGIQQHTLKTISIIPCIMCNGTGKTGVMFMTDTDEENKVVSFTITHNGVPKVFKVVNNKILTAFQLAEKHFAKLKL